MAQGSSALREPSMDEILTSIREIIEENTVQAAQLSQQSSEMEGLDRTANMIDGLNNLPSEDDEYGNLSVDEAMRTLAARIGLSMEENRSDVLPTLAEEASVAEAVSSGPVVEFPEITEQNMPVRDAADHNARDASALHEKPAPSADRQDAIRKEDVALNLIPEAEEIAETMLRPVLSAWLQQHLPDLAEKILREEITKIIAALR